MQQDKNKKINCFICNKEINCECLKYQDYKNPRLYSPCAHSWGGTPQYPMSFPYSDFVSPDPNWRHVCSKECHGKLPDDCMYKRWRP